MLFEEKISCPAIFFHRRRRLDSSQTIFHTMGKRAEQAKKRKRQQQPNPAVVSGQQGKKQKSAAGPVQLPTPVSPSSSSSLDALLSPDEIETTIAALETLAEYPEELARKEVKDVKRAVYALQRVIADGMTLGTSLTSRISAALQDYRFTDALVLLFELYIRKLPPKLGSLQRWVRECDATVSADGTVRDPDAMKCLDLILRIANPAAVGGGSSLAADVAGGAGNQLIRRNPTWTARGEVPGEIKVWEKMQNGTLFGEFRRMACLTPNTSGVCVTR